MVAGCTTSLLSILGLVLCLGACSSRHDADRQLAASYPRDLGQLAAKLPQEAMARLPEIDALISAAYAHHGPIADMDLRFRAIVAALVSDTARQGQLANLQGLTPAGAILYQRLALAHLDALWPEDYHLTFIGQSLEQLAARPVAETVLTLDAAERTALDAWIQGNHNLVAAQEDPVAFLLDAPDGPIPDFCRRFRALQDERAERAALAVRLDLALIDALLGYAHDLSLANLHDIPHQVRANQGDERLLRERLWAVLDAFLILPEESLDRLQPTYDQYGRLKTALARYREIADQGGWATLRPKRLPLRRGDRGDDVKALQQRLEQEGYGHDLGSGVFDAATAEAVKRYQRTHQFRDNGNVDSRELASLNRSVYERIAQIEVTMARWRMTRVANDSYYLLVNLPDFHGELWADGRLLHRFPVMVGAASRYRSEERGDYIYRDATPLLSSAINAVVYNPYWNVPTRIKRSLDLNLQKDPNWYENNGYEVFRSSGRVERVRQKPGPNNALGQVKILFPNREDVYLHDTPKRALFRHPMRAFSHGCIRVHEPLHLARLLLERDGRRDLDKRIAQALASDRDDWLNLQSPVPIHIEYFVVRVDDEGQVHFNADLYRHDAPLRAQRLARLGQAADDDDEL